MQPSDRNIHKLFPIETLIHTNTSNKTTHSIKHHTHKNYTIHACVSFCCIPIGLWFPNTSSCVCS